MPGVNKTLIFLFVRIPKLSSLGVERARAVKNVSHLDHNHTKNKRLKETYLLGSPSKLCKLNRTLCTLYTALHLSFRISKQMRPEKSTLG